MRLTLVCASLLTILFFAARIFADVQSDYSHMLCQVTENDGIQVDIKHKGVSLDTGNVPQGAVIPCSPKNFTKNLESRTSWVNDGRSRFWEMKIHNSFERGGLTGPWMRYGACVSAFSFNRKRCGILRAYKSWSEKYMRFLIGIMWMKLSSVLNWLLRFYPY